MGSMDEQSIIDYLAATFTGVDIVRASAENGAPEISWGDTFFIYDPDRDLEGAGRFPFATIVTKDYGDFDDLSDLDRPGVFRFNVGLDARTFDELFPHTSEPYDYTRLDVVMPHPAYRANHWVCVLNPSADTFERITPLLRFAYDRAVRRVTTRP